jgi:hypothetical protein
MKIERTKEWWMEQAKQEGNYFVSVGLPAKFVDRLNELLVYLQHSQHQLGPAGTDFYDFVSLFNEYVIRTEADKFDLGKKSLLLESEISNLSYENKALSDQIHSLKARLQYLEDRWQDMSEEASFNDFG